MPKLRTAKDLTKSLLEEGKVIGGNDKTIIVQAFGHKYQIDDYGGRKPKITQLTPENVSKK